MAEAGDRLEAYVPKLLRAPWVATERARAIDGTLVFADISGFTKLSERLARLGRVGAEELVGAICDVFTPLIDDIHAVGGDVLKFGGDALLFLVDGPDHANRAVAAAVDMRATLRRVGLVQTPIGSVRLRMSVGAHSGTFDCLVVGDQHEELLVVGPATSTTVAMEAAAEAGDILVSPATAALLPTRCIGGPKAGGHLVSRRPPSSASADRSHPLVDGERFVPLALRGRLGSVAAESEHRQAAVAFVHVGGVDGALEQDGLEGAHRALDAIAAAVVTRCAELDVTVICTDVADDGTKFMLACGAPDAVEDPEARMLRACRAILDDAAGLPVRIGVNRGAVFAGAVGSPTRFTYSTMGDAVNLAARVMGKAAPGELVATAAVVERCAGRFAHEAMEPFRVKGKSQAVAAHRVGRPHRDSAPRTVLAPLVGRERELARLLEAAAAATVGRGAAVEVVADTGMGKSHLTAHVAAAWEGRRIEVVCEQYEAATPYYAARQLIRGCLGVDAATSADDVSTALHALVGRHAPELEAWLPLLAVAADATVERTSEVHELAPRFRRARLAEAVVDLLAANTDGPLLVLVEDTPWMDDASAEVVTAVQRAAPSQPWFVLSTARPEHPVAPGPAEIVELGPLSRRDTAAVHRATSGQWPTPHVLDELVRRAEGNPLFTVELSAAITREGIDALPASLEELIGAQLDRLDAEDRRLLRYASVAGVSFDVTMLERAMGDLLPSVADPDRWQRLDHFVQEGANGEHSFRHDLFRCVAYEALPYARRRELHGRIADALVADGAAGDEALPLLSLHFTEARRPAEAWRCSVAAGARATRLYAPVEAARLYGRALTVAYLAGVGAAEVSQVARACGDAHALAAQYDAAAAAYRTARTSAPDPVASIEVLLKEGVLRERTGRYRAAVRWYLRGLRAVDALDQVPAVRSLRARLHVELAATRYRQGNLDHCITCCLAALPDAEAAEDRGALAHAYYLLDAAYTDLGRPESRLYRQLALPIYRELGDLVGEADVLNNWGVDAYYEGDVDAALEHYAECRAARTRAGDVVGAAVATSNIGEVASDEGRFDDARRLFDEALQVFEAVDYPIGVALVLGNQGLLALRTGRWDEADLLLREAQARFADLGAAPFVAEMDSRLAQLRAAVTMAGRSALAPTPLA